MTTTPATKSTRSRKAAPKTPAKRTSAKPAAKTTKRAAARAQAPTVAELSITPDQIETLAGLHQQAAAATEAFELLVVELLQAGASPSHVGKAVGLGNSSVRRILWRRVPETAPKA